jgi:hypothetical protein
MSERSAGTPMKVEDSVGFVRFFIKNFCELPPGVALRVWMDEELKVVEFKLIARSTASPLCHDITCRMPLQSMCATYSPLTLIAHLRYMVNDALAKLDKEVRCEVVL